MKKTDNVADLLARSAAANFQTADEIDGSETDTWAGGWYRGFAVGLLTARNIVLQAEP